MKRQSKALCWAAGILAAFALNAAAQPTTVLVTNYVTVIVTNVVVVTNIVAPATPPPPVPAPVAVVKPKWESAVSAGLTLTRGNSQSTLFTADFLTQKKTPFNEYQIGLAGAYSEQSSQETVNQYKVFGQWNHLFTERFFGYVRADGLRDIIADIDYRATVGPGVGYYLLKEKNTTLAFEGGGAFEVQKLDNGSDDTFMTMRAAERFEHKFNDSVRLWQNVEILPQVDRWDNYVVNFEIGVEAMLTKSFSMKTFLDDTYNNRPAPGKLKNDAKIVAAIGYKF